MIEMQAQLLYNSINFKVNQNVFILLNWLFIPYYYIDVIVIQEVDTL